MQKPTRLLLSATLVAATAVAVGCGAKTGVDDRPVDAGRDGDDDIPCQQPCLSSTFCQPACIVDGACMPLPEPDCNDDDPCTVDSCDPGIDRCVNEVVLEDLDNDEALAPIDCGGTDCDDEDPLVYPGAAERCNGIDDDCDGLIDEGADLLPWGDERPIAASEQTDDAAGIAWTGESYVIGYWDYRGGDADVYLRRVTVDGELLGDELQVTTSAGDGYGPALLWNGRELAVAWGDRRDGNFEIYFARLNSELQRLTGDIRVTNEPQWSLYPRLAWSGREYLVVWQDERRGQFEAFAQRIGPDGLAGEPVQISDAGAASATAESPEVAFDGEGYHLVWLQGQLGRYGVHHARYNQLLEPEGSSQILSTGVPGTAADPDVAASPAATAVTWERERGGSWDVVAAALTPEGALAGEPRAVNPPSTVAREATLMWDNNGFVVVYSAFGESFGLYYAVLLPTGALDRSHTPFVLSPRDAVGAVAALGPGEVGIAWSDNRSGTYDVYFTRLLCAGL